MIMDAESDWLARSAAVMDIHRTSVSTRVRLVESAWEWQVSFENILQFDAQVICAYQARRNGSIRGGGNVKLGFLTGFNLVRAERSWLCIYALVERQVKDQEINDQAESITIIPYELTYFPAI